MKGKSFLQYVDFFFRHLPIRSEPVHFFSKKSQNVPVDSYHAVLTTLTKNFRKSENCWFKVRIRFQSFEVSKKAENVPLDS